MTPLASPAVELGVEDLLPRAEVQLPVGDGKDDLVMDEQALQVASPFVSPVR